MHHLDYWNSKTKLVEFQLIIFAMLTVLTAVFIQYKRSLKAFTRCYTYRLFLPLLLLPFLLLSDLCEALFLPFKLCFQLTFVRHDASALFKQHIFFAFVFRLEYIGKYCILGQKYKTKPKHQWRPCGGVASFYKHCQLTNEVFKIVIKVRYLLAVDALSFSTTLHSKAN